MSTLPPWSPLQSATWVRLRSRLHAPAGPCTPGAKGPSIHALCTGASTLDVACSCGERLACVPAEESLLDISLEEGMDRMDLDVLHREAGKRARSINPAISDLRLAVDAAAEMQVCLCSPLPRLPKAAAAPALVRRCRLRVCAQRPRCACAPEDPVLQFPPLGVFRVRLQLRRLPRRRAACQLPCRSRSLPMELEGGAQLH